MKAWGGNQFQVGYEEPNGLEDQGGCGFVWFFFYVIVFSGLYLHLTAPGKHMAMCFI